LAKNYDVHPSTIGRYIQRNFKLRKSKKGKFHELNEREKLLRFQRSKVLYPFLEKNLPRIITSDEKIFQLPANCGQKEYFFKHSRDKSRHFFIKRQQSFPKQVMVWAGISMNGKTKLRFIRPGAKINSDYYINHVLKPFIKEDLTRLYPNNDGIFHQDSAPCHTAKKTLEFLNFEKLEFIHPTMWTPKSPDNAPMDFSVWSWMEKRLKNRNIKTLIGLKKALTQIWDELPLPMIQNIMSAWPKRCKLIYKKRGDNIEKFLKQKSDSLHC